MKCPAVTIKDGELVQCESLVEHDEHWGAHGNSSTRWRSPAELDEGVGDDGFYTAHDTLAKTKKRWDLMPWDVLGWVERVLVAGMLKPGRTAFGWKDRPREEHVEALLRHVIEYAAGKRFDNETKLPVLAHVIARALFVMWHDGEVMR